MPKNDGTLTRAEKRAKRDAERKAERGRTETKPRANTEPADKSEAESKRDKKKVEEILAHIENLDDDELMDLARAGLKRKLYAMTDKEFNERYQEDVMRPALELDAIVASLRGMAKINEDDRADAGMGYMPKKDLLDLADRLEEGELILVPADGDDEDEDD